MPEAIAAAAKHYAELGSGEGPRKRQRTSLSAGVDDEEQQDDAETIDFEVSHYILICFHQFLSVHR